MLRLQYVKLLSIRSRYFFVTMKKSNNQGECPTENFLKLISGPWTIVILWRLAQCEPIRFGALKRAVDGISARVLTERLRKLEDAGFITRDYKPTVPPEVSYALSAKGCELRQTLGTLDHLARKWESDECAAPDASK